MDRKIYKYQEYKDFIIELVELFTPTVYVEIGTGVGRVFNSVSEKVGRAVAVDLHIRNLIKRENTEFYEMNSKDFARIWNDPIDFLFIDADHHYEAALNDFLSLSFFVRPYSGLILMHDTYPTSVDLLNDRNCSDCWRAAKMIRKTMGKKFEIVTLPGPRAGLSIIRKADRHGWMDNEITT